jgi:membrane protease YdiL (CAAX protease family)
MRMFQRTDFTGAWGLKGPVAALAVYSCVLFPILHILFPRSQQWASIIYPAYFGLMVTLIILTRHATWRQLGFHKEHWKQNLCVGGLAGVLVVGVVPLLDFLIGVSGLGQAELFSGAEQRLSQDMEGSSSFAIFIISTLFIVSAQQVFLTGYVFHAMLRKIKPALAVYLGGLIFMLAHFDFQLGMFLLGLITAFFYCFNGSLIAPLIFQMACHTAGWLLAHHYPKVFTLLGFLF